MKTVRIALIGYGNVGRAFAGMLLRKEPYIMETFHAKAIITARLFVDTGCQFM